MPALRRFHSKLVTQANAYMNATWAIAVAKAGDEDGSGLSAAPASWTRNGPHRRQRQTLADEVIMPTSTSSLPPGQGQDVQISPPSAAGQYTVITERRASSNRPSRCDLT